MDDKYLGGLHGNVTRPNVPVDHSQILNIQTARDRKHQPKKMVSLSSQDELRGYIYTPLPGNTRSIRVLSIDSKPGETIRCSFRVLNLDNKPIYDCLSYTWAHPLYQAIWREDDRRIIDESPTKLIKCEGKAFKVAENLYEALKQLCKKRWSLDEHGYSGQNCIWIDAICINQNDDVEKKPQLEMMKDIYCGAENVIAWLGPDSDDPEAARLDVAIDVLERLASIPPSRRNVYLPDNLFDGSIWDTLGMEPIFEEEWLHFAAFILRSWFSRIWVVQERWAAKKMFVFCGDYVIKWKVLSDGIMTMMAMNMDRLLNSKVEEMVGSGSPPTRFVTNKIRNQFIFTDVDKTQSLTLEKLLANGRVFNATNQDDRVFGVLGMWTPSGAFLGQKPWSLIGGWTTKKQRTTEKLYTDASFLAIHEMGDLNLLSLVEDASYRKLPGLPSWVPDYTVPPATEPLNGIPRADGGVGPWNASRGLLPWKEPINADGILRVQGVKIGTIAKIAADYSEIVDEHKFCDLLELLRIAVTTEPKRNSVEQFWRALIKDNYDGQPAADDARLAFPNLITHHVWVLQIALSHKQAIASISDAEPIFREQNRQELGKFESIMDKYIDLLSKLSTEEDSLIPTLDMIQAIIDQGNENHTDFIAVYYRILADFRSAYMGRRLVRTDDNYLGIAPQSVEESDEVWILAGAFVPIILRREGVSDKRKLVGEAYINGCMNGETVDPRNVTDLEII
ncbi:hypothetical protein HYFRA_00013099 [Hymenoscyphus fraxineus]|uniref:Heterokaryon incompatibility domain-containing protein n=1 Tax=Hymenoscyphus fraxineus TaxID=746836 RepID=A0A9N9PM82_9HELO|nr:hypothetical protein HYFRA_00013099 [Hymenoscyphus fraxineus]